MKKDKRCILYPYKKEENCMDNHEKCYSLSNIYYGTLIKFSHLNKSIIFPQKYPIEKRINILKR